ncbi:MAG TPA: methionine ABC transporter substrate-binding protein [Syntrophomonas sp.]|jgi:D-methionine transport system substrate-binding protein|nr:methionine ABC transporter substrate-binding protein [Syntrophomonas sp.]
MKRGLILIACLLLLLTSVVGCSNQQPAAEGDKNAQPAATKLVVGATAKPHAEILEVVKPLLAKENVDLEIKVFTDYVLLNPSLKDGQIDANFFQHIPYLDDYNAKNNADLVWTVKVHNEPMGVYSKKIKNLDELTTGAKVGIPNDATNGGRALMVLEQAKLITLKEGAGVTATENDIIENPKKIAIIAMDAAMLPRTLEDADICVINSNYALEGNLNPVTDAIFSEPKDSPFANVLAVRPADKDKEAIVKLGKALQSPEVKKFLEDNYAGSCVPSF